MNYQGFLIAPVAAPGENELSSLRILGYGYSRILGLYSSYMRFDFIPILLLSINAYAQEI